MSWTYKIKESSDECCECHPLGYCELLSLRGNIVMCRFENCPYEEKESD